MISETVEDNTKPRTSVHMAHHCEANKGYTKCTMISQFSPIGRILQCLCTAFFHS